MDYYLIYDYDEVPNRVCNIFIDLDKHRFREKAIYFLDVYYDFPEWNEDEKKLTIKKLDRLLNNEIIIANIFEESSIGCTIMKVTN